MISQLRGLSQNNRDVEIPTYLVILVGHSFAFSNLAFSYLNKDKYVILLKKKLTTSRVFESKNSCLFWRKVSPLEIETLRGVPRPHED